MTFREIEDRSGIYEYRGQKVRIDLYTKPDGQVEKLAIHYPDELFTKPQNPDFLRAGWSSKEEALNAAMARAKEVIDRKI